MRSLEPEFESPRGRFFFKMSTEPSTDPYIELNAFVKLKNLATTGGQAKNLIRSGVISVNGIPETRNRKKLHAGDRITFGNQTYILETAMIKPHQKAEK